MICGNPDSDMEHHHRGKNDSEEDGQENDHQESHEEKGEDAWTSAASILDSRDGRLRFLT